MVALNKSDINEKKETKIDIVKLSETLGCPVIQTISTNADGLQGVIDAVMSVIGKGQKAPYEGKEETLTDKAAAMEADRKRYAFVNNIVVLIMHFLKVKLNIKFKNCFY